MAHFLCIVQCVTLIMMITYLECIELVSFNNSFDIVLKGLLYLGFFREGFQLFAYLRYYLKGYLFTALPVFGLTSLSDMKNHEDNTIYNLYDNMVVSLVGYKTGLKLKRLYINVLLYYSIIIIPNLVSLIVLFSNYSNQNNFIVILCLVSVFNFLSTTVLYIEYYYAMMFEFFDMINRRQTSIS